MGEDRRTSLTWRSWPLVESKKKNLLVSSLVFAVLISIYLFSSNYGWVIFSALVLLGALRSYFLPTYYTLDEIGIFIRTPFSTQKRAWSQICSFYVDAHGVLLSPFSHPSRLENFRGIYLRFSRNRDQVVTFLKQKEVSCPG